MPHKKYLKKDLYNVLKTAKTEIGAISKLNRKQLYDHIVRLKLELPNQHKKRKAVKIKHTFGRRQYLKIKTTSTKSILKKYHTVNDWLNNFKEDEFKKMKKEYDEVKKILKDPKYKTKKYTGLVAMMTKKNIEPYEQYVKYKKERIILAKKLRKIDPKLI